MLGASTPPRTVLVSSGELATPPQRLRRLGPPNSIALVHVTRYLRIYGSAKLALRVAIGFSRKTMALIRELPARTDERPMDWALFVSKKIVSAFFYPVGTALLCWLTGLIFWLFRPRSRVGFGLVTLGGLWLLIMSLPATGFFMLRSLEIHAGSYADPQVLARKNTRFVVVLGGDLRPGELTAPDRLACTSLTRVMEGIRLWRGIPGSKLILSGGRYSRDVMSSAEGMAILARDLGVPAEAMVLESQSRDTRRRSAIAQTDSRLATFCLGDLGKSHDAVTHGFQKTGPRTDSRACRLRGTPLRSRFLDVYSRFTQSCERLENAIHEYTGHACESHSEVGIRLGRGDRL